MSPAWMSKTPNRPSGPKHEPSENVGPPVRASNWASSGYPPRLILLESATSSRATFRQERATHARVVRSNCLRRELLLPKLGPGLSREWGWYRGAEDLLREAPGRCPPEPSGPAISSDILSEVGALLMPAILVDRQGRRIGQGGGWYDRVLKHQPHHQGGGHGVSRGIRGHSVTPGFDGSAGTLCGSP